MFYRNIKCVHKYLTIVIASKYLEMEEQQNVKFGLKSINEESCRFANDSILNGNIEVSCLQYKYFTVTEVFPKEDTIVVHASLRYFSSKNNYFELEMSLEFFVNNLRGVVSYNQDSREITFSPNLIPTFLNTTCGTVRGILAEKVKGKSIERFPLPLLPLAMLEKNNNISVRD